MRNNRILPTLIVGLVGAVVGSFLMMLYASGHFGTATGPDRTPPAIAAVPLSGVSDQDRIVSAVKRTKSSVVAITEEVNGQEVMPADPFYPTRSGPPAVRLSFGHLPVEEAGEGVSRLGRAFGRLLAS